MTKRYRDRIMIRTSNTWNVTTKLPPYLIYILYVVLGTVTKPQLDLQYHISKNNLLSGYYQPNHHLTNSSLLTLITRNSEFKRNILIHSDAYEYRKYKQNQRKLQAFEEISS